MTDAKSKLVENITKKIDSESKLEDAKTKSDISESTKSLTVGVISESPVI